jgi:hypothetical protein
LIIDLYGTFEDCYSLKHVPVSIFDNNPRLENLERLFLDCNIHGESPYTIINGVKYHLYERYMASDYFVTPTNTFYCFRGVRNLTDIDQIPDTYKDKETLTINHLYSVRHRIRLCVVRWPLVSVDASFSSSVHPRSQKQGH